MSAQALFVPCANETVQDAANKDALVFNPQIPETTGTLSLYHFLGKIIGLCLRHKVPLAVALGQGFWKGLAKEKMGLADVAATDVTSARMIATAYVLAASQSESNSVDSAVLEEAKRYSNVDLDDLDEDDVEDMVEATAAALQTLLAQVPDVGAVGHLQGEDGGGGGGGSKDDVAPTASDSVATEAVCSQSELHVIADRAKRWLLVSQHHLKATALAAGMACSVPIQLLPMFSGPELETVFCGAPRLDVDLLERVAVYGDNCARTDPHIEFFWSALRDDECFTEAQRAQFLHFCWARSRLPTSVDGFTMPFTIDAPSGSAAENPDAHLPTSRTCFFTLALPRYTSREVLVQKLKYAIVNTKSMDADFKVSNDER